MIEDLKKIISDGVYAPSGENCQPWKFEIRTNPSESSQGVVRIHNVPEADQSLYNSGQKGSYVAHGALIENISISALQHGYSASVEVFPKTKGPADTNLVAVITFSKNAGGAVQNTSVSSSLYPFINKRCTNRKDQTPQKISADEKSQLVNAARETGFAELKIVDDQPTLDILGQALAINEEIIFENKHLHDFFYDHLLWKEEDQGKAGGFYFKTLEFLPHQLKGVKLFKSWGILNFLNKIGKVSKKIAKENALKYASSGALAAVVIPGSSDADFVNGGRAMERVWLTATSLGLAAHPCTGVLYFMQRIKVGDTTSFSPEHTALITKAYADIEKAFGTQGKTIPMLFRIGYADAPTARSQRMAPDITSAIL
jgi:nitroreductase